jgi:hypothetical protein
VRPYEVLWEGQLDGGVKTVTLSKIASAAVVKARREMKAVLERVFVFRWLRLQTLEMELQMALYIQ